MRRGGMGMRRGGGGGGMWVFSMLCCIAVMVIVGLAGGMAALFLACIAPAKRSDGPGRR